MQKFLACVHHKSPFAAAALVNKNFCANILHEGWHRTGHAERFDGFDWIGPANGQPMITGATANFDCVLRSSVLWQTHRVMIAHVPDVALNEDQRTLRHGQRSYRKAVGFDPRGEN